MKPEWKIGAGGRLLTAHPEGWVYITPPTKTLRYWLVSTSFDAFATAHRDLSDAQTYVESVYFAAVPGRLEKENK